ncbi:hypothetical protein, partial [Escherichia coli]|uniref:hypothetical protein n=1 Tax=Escherichia coli TaxID=562 RepID=UPI001BC89C87
FRLTLVFVVPVFSPLAPGQFPIFTFCFVLFCLFFAFFLFFQGPLSLSVAPLLLSFCFFFAIGLLPLSFCAP